MDVAIDLLAVAAAALSALALYRASPHCRWRPARRRGGLRLAGAVLALVSLGAWTASIGFAPGLCAMLACWMLALVLLPYLAWWTGAGETRDARPASRAVMPRSTRAVPEVE